MYAKNTSVPIDRSKSEIERIIHKYGADQFVSGWDSLHAKIGFRMKDRYVQFRLPLIVKSQRRYDSDLHKYVGENISEDQAAQRNRARWRAMVLVLKAKLESVEAGISDFETEFLGNVMVGNGQIVADLVKPELEKTYASGNRLCLTSGFK